MKTAIVFAFFFLVFSLYGSAQSRSFRAVYEGLITTDELLKTFDSVNVKGNKTGDKKIPATKVPIMQMRVMKLEVHVTGEKVVVKRMEDQHVRNVPGSDSPDSTVFENNTWYKYKDGKAVLKTSFTGKLSKTGELKKIGTYDCVKYLWEVPENSRITELWVAKALPSGISPFTVTIPVEGAVLESRQLGSNFTYKLIELKKK